VLCLIIYNSTVLDLLLLTVILPSIIVSFIMQCVTRMPHFDKRHSAMNYSDECHYVECHYDRTFWWRSFCKESLCTTSPWCDFLLNVFLLSVILLSVIWWVILMSHSDKFHSTKMFILSHSTITIIRYTIRQNVFLLKSFFLISF